MATPAAAAAGVVAPFTSSSACSFYSLTAAGLVESVESSLRVVWHWDRDDEVDPRASEADQQMRGGCHCIVQMQVADTMDDDSRAPTAAEAEPDEAHAGTQHEVGRLLRDRSASTGAGVLAEGSESAAHLPVESAPSQKRRKITSERFAAGSTAEDAPAALPTLDAAPVLPAAVHGVVDLDSLSPSVVFTSILTSRVLSRATILIPQSARFHRLFYSYYDLFIVRQQSEHHWRTDGCPVWLHRFELNLFNQRLAAMRTLAAEDASEASFSSVTTCTPLAYSTPFSSALEWSLLRSWRASPFDFALDDVPAKFPIFIANYSNSMHQQPSDSSAPADSAPWVGDLLVLPLRTIHGVLSSSPSACSVRLKYFLGYYIDLPAKDDASGFAIGHGPGRSDAREYEERAAWAREDEASDEVKEEWRRIRLDEEAWTLWRGDQAKSTSIDGAQSKVRLPIGVEVSLQKKASAELAHQQRQSLQLLSDLQRHSCSLVRGIFPSSLSTAGRTLSYLHRLLRLPGDFSLTSTAPFHARAFHDAAVRHQFGLTTTHLRRQPNDHTSTHVQASHGNTAYGAYCAAAVEASLFLQPLVHTIWKDWRLGQPAPAEGQATDSRPPRLRTIEIGYQAPLPPAPLTSAQTSQSVGAPPAANKPSQRSSKKRR